MDSYQPSLGVSRQTTGLLFVISLCIHALVLCVLFLSYHVQSLLLTRQLKQAVPAAQGLDRSTVLFKNPQAQSGTAQNQTTAPQQQQNQQTQAQKKTEANDQTQQATGAAMSKTPNNAQESQQQQTVRTSSVKKAIPKPLQEETEPQENAADHENHEPAKTSEAVQKIARPITSIIKTDARLELPISQQTDSIPVQADADTAKLRLIQYPKRSNTYAEQAPVKRIRRSSATTHQANRTPWYKAASPDRAYPQASAAQPVQKITLQDVTRGFLKSVQQEKRMTTQSHNQLSTHDMVSKSYETKVYNMLQKSVLVEAKPINMHHPLSTVAEVVLTLDRAGKIVSFEFNHPLPKKDLKAVEDQLRRAAHSTGLYPSFPRIFTQNTYRFSLPLHIEITKGQHSYRLTTNYRPL